MNKALENMEWREEFDAKKPVCHDLQASTSLTIWFPGMTIAILK